MTPKGRILADKPESPSQAEIDDLLQRIVKTPAFLRAPRTSDFLEYLFKAQRHGRYNLPFSKAKPRPTGKRIYYEFDLQYSKSHGERPPEDADEAEPKGKKAIRTLRALLTAFNAISTERVSIDVPIGKSGFEPVCTYKKKSKSTKSPESNLPEDRSLTCEVVGNERDARAYLAERLRLSKTTAPKIVSIREMHSRSKTRFGGVDDRSEFLATLSTALRSAPIDTLIMTVIFGQIVDPVYAGALQEVADGNKNLDCYRLRTAGARMDFTLIDFNDGTTVVVFGGGQGSSASSGQMFRSDDERLTGEFDQLFEAALQSSDLLPVAALLETLPGTDDKAIRLEPKWNQGRFEELIKGLKRDQKRASLEEDGDLFICTTFFVGDTPLRSKLIEALGRGLRIKVLMLDPDNAAMLSARFGLRTDSYSPQTAKHDLEKQITMLSGLMALVDPEASLKGSVEVRLSNKMPSGFVAHSRDWAIMGVMLARESYAEGPMIEVQNSHTSLWRHINDDWHARWNDPDNKPLSR